MSYSLAKKYTAEDLNSMTVANIKSLAVELGYSITVTKKTDVIEQFLTEQGD